jgi:anhydro-N-acetylmuramic acid kinase
VFGRTGRCSAVLNLGGMANLTALRANGEVGGFDCGPGNVLLDHWCQASTGQAFDRGGAWATTGRVHPALLASFLTEPFFALPVPKSTGRDLFGAAWLDAHLKHLADARAADVQATLSELTAVVCARDVEGHAPEAEELLVCGGGALNEDLMARLQRLLPHMAVQATDACGLPAQQVEACAFAWLAKAFVDRSCGNLASVTGARGPRILGALYPAG